MSTEDAVTSTSDNPAAPWLVQRIKFASAELNDCIERNPRKMNGIPVVKGSRISVAQVLAEIAEGATVDEVADDYSLDPGVVKRIVSGFSICLDQPLS